MAMTEAAKRADKKYNRNMVKAQANFKKNDLIEGKRLLAYLESTGETMNNYVKSLIKADLDSKSVPYPDGDTDAEYVEN